jgi:hypothetical protein
MPVGKVISSKVAKNRDGEKDVLLLEVEISEPEDIQTAESIRLAGIDSTPPVGSIVFINDSGEAWKIAVAINDNIKPDTEPGETEIYSSSDGEKLAKVRCTSDGKTRVNDGDDNAVRFSKLEEAYNDVQSKLNALIVTFIAHVHPGVTSGSASTGVTPPPSPQESSTPIAPAKIDNFEVP